MDTKIQELTDKIYKEGVEKGNEEAGRIIADANAQKQAILTEAEAEAKRIVAQAEKQAAELKKNTEAELKLFATQSVEALKSEVVNLITGKITSSNVKAIVSDTAFMQKVILEMAKEWVVKEAITIRTADADALTKYFEANAKSLLDGGVKIEKVSGHDASFTIVPADGSYKVSFGEDEFVAFFKEFLEESNKLVFSETYFIRTVSRDDCERSIMAAHFFNLHTSVQEAFGIGFKIFGESIGIGRPDRNRLLHNPFLCHF